ncbi:MAG TPA: radical SAM protein [Cyclobacteriaceae bacterium]|nr:radical SAM protein [Cyclobacteriaceae bacterium]
MSKALFTHSYFYPLDYKQWQFKQPYPPLMTLQAAAIAREKGFDVSLFDSNLRKDPREIITTLEKQKPAYFILIDDGFNYLTKMCLSVMREAAFCMIQEAKKRGCVVIVNSSDSTDHADQYLKQGADYIIRGEMDETLSELLALLESSKSVKYLEGISYRKEEVTVTTPSRAVLRDLNNLPRPAWDLVDMESYRSIWLKYHGYFSLNIATTRGCPFKCNWCAKPIYGNRYHSRSPEHVVNEIEYLLKTFQPDHFWMCDDIFGLKPGWIQEFNKLVKQRNLKFAYKIQSRVDLLLEENTIEALAESGAQTVWVGAESGSQKILDAMDKGTTVDQIAQATRLLRQHGLKVGHFLQFGYVNETKEDIHATLNMVLDLVPDEIGISVSYPLPGTKFHENVKAGLKEKQNWTDSDDLALMFISTYPPAYYKILHRYVHNRYRMQRGVNQLKKSFVFTKTGLRNIASMIYNTPLSWIHAYQLNKLGQI